jgi:tRNA G18 (ribose-2'-O)-methylase SpoU
VCVDLQTDGQNCGACFHTCDASQSCVDGLCQTYCTVDVCVDLQTDPQNCGACGNACAAFQTCIDGVCCP